MDDPVQFGSLCRAVARVATPIFDLAILLTWLFIWMPNELSGAETCAPEEVKHYIRMMEKKMETTIVPYITLLSILGLYWDNGKENGNYYLGT